MRSVIDSSSLSDRCDASVLGQIWSELKMFAVVVVAVVGIAGSVAVAEVNGPTNGDGPKIFPSGDLLRRWVGRHSTATKSTPEEKRAELEIFWMKKR